MMSSDARERLPKAEQELANLHSSRRLVALHVANFDRKLGELDAANRPLAGFERKLREDYVTYLHLLRGNGIPSTVGVDSDLTSLVGVPGLAVHDQKIAALESEMAALRAVIDRWPTPETTYRYRYVGPRHGHLHDGHYLDPGAVVELTEDRASAWRDRFEPVEEAEAVSAS